MSSLQSDPPAFVGSVPAPCVPRLTEGCGCSRLSGLPGSRSVPTGSGEELKQHLTGDGDEEFSSKVADEVRAAAQHNCWGEAPSSFSVGQGCPSSQGHQCCPPQQEFPFWGHLHKSVTSPPFSQRTASLITLTAALLGKNSTPVSQFLPRC